MKTSTEPVKRFKKLATNKSLGPVDELESHVHPEWWQHIFNSLYIKTDGDVIDDSDITSAEVDTILSLLTIHKEAHILDVCCGQGRHCFEFYKRGYLNVEGVDRSSYLINKARLNNRKTNCSIKFREGDARKLSYRENTFDYVLLLGNSFGYFECCNEDVQVLRSVHKLLKAGGKLLIDIADGEYLKNNFQPRSWEWIGSNLFVCRERCLSANGKKLISREVITQTDKGVIADQFYSENLYGSNDLKNLVHIAGFGNILITDDYKVNSKRNQDLGIMENRLFLTACVEK